MVTPPPKGGGRGRIPMPSRFRTTVLALLGASLLGSMWYDRQLPSMRQITLKESHHHQQQHQPSSTAAVPWSTGEESAILPTTGPRLVWLLSFPNSGTSYTMRNTLMSSQRNVASNYGKEVKVGIVRSLYPTVPSPYLLHDKYATPDLVLTKTHCVGYGEKQAPVLDVDQFEYGCRAYSYNHSGVRDWQHYSNNLVRKAIHLVRNPFDNLVARKHLGLSRRRNVTTWVNNYGEAFRETSEGMVTWCWYTDDLMAGEMETIMAQLGLAPNLWQDLPCHTEWYRWVQWHNLAIEMVRRMDIPVHTVYYEDYAHNFKPTVRGILHFLELKQEAPLVEFEVGKSYDFLYDDHTAYQAAAFVRAVASPECWGRIRHYFAQWTEADDVRHGGGSLMTRQGPWIAQLLSFPSSGESYTIQNTWAMTNTTTASTAVQQLVLEDRVSLRPELSQVPFVDRPDLRTPDLVLTTSPCTGFCFKCPPTTSVSSFDHGCRTGLWTDGSPALNQETYGAELVEKAVLQIRNPMTVVSMRQIHGLGQQNKLGYSNELRDMFLDKETGLIAWCAYLDETFKHFIPLSLHSRDDVERLLDIPCHSEFIRYVSWYNAALNMTGKLGIPVHTLFYENYTEDFEVTATKLYGYLRLPIVRPPAPRKSDDGRIAHFLTEQILEIGYLVENLASPALWSLLKHYFPRWKPVIPSSTVVTERSIAWLMSFPHSEISNTSAATSYGEEIEENIKTPVRADMETGPWLIRPSSNVPRKVLTITKCAGTYDPYTKLVVSADEFARGCRETSRGEAEGRFNYSLKDRVAGRIVHLIRNPFEVLVERKRQDLTTPVLHELTALLNASMMHQDTREGFLAWCRIKDSLAMSHAEVSGWSSLSMRGDLKAWFSAVPCSSELFRQIQWHNSAIKASTEMKVPVHHLHYDDYATTYNLTVTGLLQFLDLKAVRDGIPFQVDQGYHVFFDSEHAKKITGFVRAYASPACWLHIERYFTRWSDSAVEAVKNPTRAIVWLLSFPNSGTTYTMTNVEWMSYSSVAVNYRKESDAQTLLRKDRPDGPFVHNSSLSLPRLVLTKTHCDGYCDDCGMSKSFIPLDKFESGCSRSEKQFLNGRLITRSYPTSDVSKAVHLMRHPLDNCVSRMHHGVYRRRRFLNWTEDRLSIFNTSREGLLSWCSYIDMGFWNLNAGRLSGLSDEVRRSIASVPCGSDLFRYVQWHNNAVELTTKLNLPVHVLYYEDYSSRFNATLRTLFDFLELPIVNSPIPFESSKTYEQLFDSNTRMRAWELIQNLSSNRVWDLLKRYTLTVTPLYPPSVSSRRLAHKTRH